VRRRHLLAQRGRQILLHRAAGLLGITIPAPILTFDRALLVGIGRNEARINCKAFTTNQTGRNARLDDPLGFCIYWRNLARYTGGVRVK
jgi:hypothetical protein